MPYLPTLASVRTHPLPEWYSNAKFGIFIHWTPASVPAYAPTGEGDFFDMAVKYSPEYAFAHQPYVEWYWNSLRIPGSPAQRYHAEHYGADTPFTNFKDEFKRQVQQWQPQAWADLFQKAGARYAVLVTKHHDGFLLWHSRVTHPNLPGYHSERNVPAELAAVLRQRGIKVGFYYSSLLDWSFTSQPLQTFADLMINVPKTPEYLSYVETHWHELIDELQPDLLWNDIGYPSPYNLNELFAYYYNRVPEGVVNDRWLQIPRFLRNKAGHWLMNALVKRSLRSGTNAQPQVPHCDFRTTEYSGFEQIQPKKWEACRGIGHSFGYNQFETDKDYSTATELVPLLVDIVSKNGNLLLNVGPRPDGSIPEPQLNALEGIGAWLNVNGEAIYDTHPFLRPGDRFFDGSRVAYTQKGKIVYIHLLEWKGNPRLVLPSQVVSPSTTITCLATGKILARQVNDQGVEVDLEGINPEEIVPVLKADPLE
jgi:alpha-L-fucosidase